MNEELQREIVNILRAMKDGSPDAFKVLVEQRSLYCWGQFAFGVVLTIASAALLLVCVKMAARVMKAAGDGDAYFFASLVAGLAGIAGGLAGVIHLSSVSEAIAPLGRVLEILR